MSKVYNFSYEVECKDLVYTYEDGFEAPSSCNVVAIDFETAKKLAARYMTTEMMNPVESAAVSLIDTLVETLPNVATTTVEDIGHMFEITLTVKEMETNQVL